MLTEEQKQEIQAHLAAIQGVFHTAIFANETFLAMTVQEMFTTEAARQFAVMSTMSVTLASMHKEIDQL